MVGNPTLREVVGTDLGRAVSGAYLGKTESTLTFLTLSHLLLEKPGAEDAHGLLLVLELAFLVLTRYNEASGLMRDPDGRVRCIHALATRAARTIDVDLKVIRRDLNFYLLGLRQHGHRRCRGVDTTLALGLGDPLDPMCSTLVLIHRVGSVTFDLDYNLFVAADLRRV